MQKIQNHTQYIFKVLFIRKIRDDECIKPTQNLILLFKKMIVDAISYAQNQQEKDILKADLCFAKQTQLDYVIVVGGDGTMIYVSNLFNHSKSPPILGFAKGSAPILYNFSLRDIDENYPKFLKNMKSKVVKSQDCLRLHIKKRNLKNHQQQLFQNVAFSEVVIHRGKNNSCVKIVIYIDDQQLTTFFGDGIIFATPYGSLAYSLNSNGPIIANSINSIVAVPICPLSLSFRPICLSAKSKIRLRLSEKSRCTGVVSCDGLKTGLQITMQDELEIYESNFPLTIVNQIDENSKSTWIKKLKAVLKWGDSFTG